ncbi:MAG: glycosyl hydrolase, partial [Phycisphaerales bacterium JB040]
MAVTIGGLLLLLLAQPVRALSPDTGGYDHLRAGFQDPPPRARPDAFWPWLNGHADPERLTAEMEAFRSAGFSRLQVWDVLALQDPERIVPTGPAFLSDAWLTNLAHANHEAERLGLELGMVAASGWNAGGAWVAPENAGLGLYSSVRPIQGPATLDLELAFPEVPAHCPRAADGQPAYWRTVAVQASPDADSDLLVPEHVVDLTARLGDDGRLRWEAPAGIWTIRWFVFANTGQRLIVPSPNSDGLQIDFFDADDSRAYFTHVLGRLESALGPLEDTAFRYLEVDSLELEGARLGAWTEDILEAFQARYQYDARPWISLLTDPSRADERGERFLHDWTRLVSDLMIENHYRLGDELLRARGRLLAAEAGGPGPPIWNSCPVDAMGALGAVGLLRGEFWPKHRSIYNVKQIACAAHTYGRTIVDAEAFTSWRHWRDGPYYLKLLADQAFVDGLNHITFHTAPHGGAETGLPGLAYHAGTHMGPNLIWWPMARPFIDYLSRCSFLLQEGRPVADVCFYQGDGAPAFHPLAVDWDPDLRPAGYDYDVVDVRILTGAMGVREGRIQLPHGVSYALLVLPDEESIDLTALRKVREMVREGATVLGPRPVRANGLAHAPGSDEEVRSLAHELWGDIEGRQVTEHQFGKGRIVQGRTVLEVLDELLPDFAWEGGDRRTRLSYVHRTADDVEIYFVVNNHERWEDVDGLFRVSGKRPELWDPSSGEIVRLREFRADGARTRVRLRLPPGGSTFVIFRSDPEAPGPVAYTLDPLPRVQSAAPHVAHSDTPNGPAWVSAGEGPPHEEFIVYDLGATVELGHAEFWNFQDQARGLLTRGIREMDVSASPGGMVFEPLDRVELARAPEIGERGYQQRLELSAARSRYVRLDIVSNHSDDWSGRTDSVGLNRVAFFDVDGEEIESIRVHKVSSGIAHDPRTDSLRAAAREGFELPGPWRLRFQKGRGAPQEALLPELISWTDSEDAAIRHFSGIAEYTMRFQAPAELL